MTDPYMREPQGFFDRIMQRLDGLESRLNRIIPRRLSPVGQEVTDWNNAVEVGFYQSGAGSLNGPDGYTNLAGIVTRRSDRIIQEVWSDTITDNQRVRSWTRVFASGTWRPWVYKGPAIFWGTISAVNVPSFWPVGIVFGVADASFPTGSGATVEIISTSTSTAVQRVTDIGSTTSNRVYHRSSIDANTWGPWVRDAGDSDWQAPTLVNDFTNGSNAGYRRLGDIVHLRGELLRATAPTSSTTAFTLPVGYRPSTRVRTVNWSSSGDPALAVFLTVNAGGAVDILSSIARTSTPGFHINVSYPAA